MPQVLGRGHPIIFSTNEFAKALSQVSNFLFASFVLYIKHHVSESEACSVSILLLVLVKRQRRIDETDVVILLDNLEFWWSLLLLLLYSNCMLHVHIVG